jgi:NADH-quinone oxidoreductase subunit M
MSHLSYTSFFLIWFCLIASPHFRVLVLVLVFVTAQLVLMHSNTRVSSLLFSLVLITLVLVTIFFVTFSLLCLYLSFEATLIPVFFIIYLFGYQPEKLSACFWLLLYTLIGSLPLLFFISTSLSVSISGLTSTCPVTVLFLSLAFLVKRPLFLLHA